MQSSTQNFCEFCTFFAIFGKICTFFTVFLRMVQVPSRKIVAKNFLIENRVFFDIFGVHFRAKKVCFFAKNFFCCTEHPPDPITKNFLTFLQFLQVLYFFVSARQISCGLLPGIYAHVKNTEKMSKKHRNSD